MLVVHFKPHTDYVTNNNPSNTLFKLHILCLSTLSRKVRIMSVRVVIASCIAKLCYSLSLPSILTNFPIVCIKLCSLTTCWYTSCQEKVWICKTCDISLKRGSMPAQSKANNLLLQDVPPELSELNTMEVRLISLRIPFMKMVALPCGKQRMCCLNTLLEGLLLVT